MERAGSIGVETEPGEEVVSFLDWDGQFRSAQPAWGGVRKRRTALPRAEGRGELVAVGQEDGQASVYEQ